MRRAALDRAVATEVSRGGRVEALSDYQAIIVHGKRVNHLLHLILTIVFIGMWAIVWLLLIIFGGEKRVILTVDERGKVTRRRA